MMARRRLARAISGPWWNPSPSGPRCTSRPDIAATTCASASPPGAWMPAMPHMLGSVAGPQGGLRDAGLGLDQAAADRVADQLDAVAHAQLAQHVRPVRLHGLLRQVQDLGDLGVRV